MRNLHASDAVVAGHISGLPEAPISRLSLAQVAIFSRYGLALKYADQVSLQEVHIEARSGAAILSGPAATIDSH